MKIRCSLQNWMLFCFCSIYSNSGCKIRQISNKYTAKTNRSNGQIAIFVNVHRIPFANFPVVRGEPIVCLVILRATRRNNGYLDNGDRGSFDSRGQNAPWPGAGWKRNSIPRYLNTSQLRVMYEGCVSYVYFCHFLSAPRIWMSSPSPAHSSQFIPARHRESPESRDDLHFRKIRTARVRFCKSDKRYHT